RATPTVCSGGQAAGCRESKRFVPMFNQGNPMSKRSMLPRSRLALGLAIALAAAPAFAQQTSSAVSGIVLGTDGSPVAGAEIIITHTASGTTKRVTTDEAGRYNSRGLRVG